MIGDFSKLISKIRDTFFNFKNFYKGLPKIKRRNFKNIFYFLYYHKYYFFIGIFYFLLKIKVRTETKKYG